MLLKIEILVFLSLKIFLTFASIMKNRTATNHHHFILAYQGEVKVYCYCVTKHNFKPV